MKLARPKKPNALCRCEHRVRDHLFSRYRCYACECQGLQAPLLQRLTERDEWQADLF